jgi:AcrR family transcriptional regulator
MRALPGRESRTSLPEPPPAVTRRSAAAAQRARIRRATAELVAKRGYSGTSVELIIKRAHVGFKTYYKHYANKEQAFLDLFDTVVYRTEALAAEALAVAEVSWPEQVVLALQMFAKAVLDEPLIARACIVEGPTAGPAVLERYDRLSTAFSPILRRGREYNPEAASLPDTLEDTLAGAVLWSVYQRLSFSETERIAELLPENIELVLRPYLGEAEAARIAAAAPAVA